MFKQTSIIDTLEPRQLFSGHGLSTSGHGKPTTSTTTTSTTATTTVTQDDIKAGQALVKQDQLTLNADRKKYDTLLRTDSKAYRDAVKALAAQLKPLQDAYDDDAGAYTSAVKTSATSIKSVYAQYTDALQSDKDAIKHASDDTAKAAAQAQFNTDKAAFEAALTAAKSKVDGLRKELKHDRSAISTLITNDPTASAALAKYLADCTERSNVLAADSAKLKADRDQLKLEADAFNKAKHSSGSHKSTDPTHTSGSDSTKDSNED